MEYPFEEGFRKGEWKGMVRLKVAAICACIDNSRCGGIPSSALEEEIEQCCRQVEKMEPDGSLRNRPIDPHAFLYIEPEGNLAGDVSDILEAMIASIQSGELKSASLRVALDGTVSPTDTWIFIPDFRKWCKTREVSLDDVFDEYVNSEWEIFSHAENNAHDMRKALEAPLFDANFLKIRQPGFDTYEGLLKRYEELFLDHFLGLQGGAEPTTPADPRCDRPVTANERNTLLLIIAALAERAGIDYSHRGAASAVAATIEVLGAKVTPETVRDKFDMIPDAISRREVVLAKRAKQK